MTSITKGVEQLDSQAQQSSWKGRIAPALLSCALGLVLLYAAGFAKTEALHDAAHDGRHSAGFPCH
jgi:cobalt transporter subunit CbtB